MEFMKVALTISLIISLCKGAAWIGLGILLSTHFKSLAALLSCRNLPEDPPSNGSPLQAMQILKIIGVLFIILGIGIIVLGSISFIKSLSLGGEAMNLKF